MIYILYDIYQKYISYKNIYHNKKVLGNKIMKCDIL